MKTSFTLLQGLLKEKSINRTAKLNSELDNLTLKLQDNLFQKRTSLENLPDTVWHGSRIRLSARVVLTNEEIWNDPNKIQYFLPRKVIGKLEDFQFLG
jgi:hypothetical protein